MDTERARELGEAEQERSSDVLSYDEQPSDAAQTIFDREEELSIVGHAEAELREVEHAVRKLDEGTYGLDEESGEPIPDERLEAMPATRFTVRNQRIDEKRAGVPDDRTTGDPTATSGGGRLAR